MTDDLHVIRKYDKAASAYDRRWHRYHAETLSRIAPEVRAGPASVILDVPCGTGELTRWLLPRVPDARIVGVDGSVKMVQLARTKWHAQPRLTFLQARAEALPFNDRCFDWIVCGNSLHYFHHPEQVFAEFARVLKPDGRLLILDWCRNPWHCRLLNWWKVWFDPSHVRMYTTHELEQLFSEQGLSMAQMDRFKVRWFGGLKLWEMMYGIATRANGQ